MKPKIGFDSGGSDGGTDNLKRAQFLGATAAHRFADGPLLSTTLKLHDTPCGPAARVVSLTKARKYPPEKYTFKIPFHLVAVFCLCDPHLCQFTPLARWVRVVFTWSPYFASAIPAASVADASTSTCTPWRHHGSPFRQDPRHLCWCTPLYPWRRVVLRQHPRDVARWRMYPLFTMHLGVV